MISPSSDSPPTGGSISFLASVGHELRNPLSSLLGQAELLQDGLYGPVAPAQEEALQTMVAEVRRMLALLADLGDVGRSEAGKLELCPGPCDLEALRTQALAAVEASAAARKITLTSQPAPEGLHLFGDETRLRQMLQELLAAAVACAPTGADIGLRISLPSSGGLLLQAGGSLSFEDFCCPPLSPPEPTVLQQLLSLKPIGVALLQHLVRLHGGAFSACSLPGSALCVCAHLPLPLPMPVAAPQPEPQVVSVAPQAPQPEVQPAAAEAAAATLPPLILLADDQPTLLTVTTHYLEAIGLRVETARDGQEAVLLAHKHKPDLILMDVRMPVLEGPVAIQTIRGSTDPKVRNVPIISLSGQHGSIDRDRCLAAGANAHLNKPFSITQLDPAIRQFVTPPG